MSKTLAAIQARLKSTTSHTDNPSTQSNFTFKVSSMAIGDTARIRFIPDPANPTHVFWLQQSNINIVFPGTVTNPHTPVSCRIIPTPEIMELNKQLWKTDEETARRLYPKKSYIAQAIVKSDPTDQGLEGKLVRITISPQIYKVVHSTVMDESLEALPSDMERGLDFSIIKTKQGEFANYSTSTFARKETALTPEERELALSAKPLSDFLPDSLVAGEAEQLLAAYTAAINGDLFDDTKLKMIKVYPVRK